MEQADIILREATILDVADLAQIKLAAIHDSMPYKKFVRNQTEEEAYLAETFNRCRVVIAVSGNKGVGFVAFDEHFLEQLYINPPFQNQGIGSELIHYAQDQTSTLRLAVDNENKNGIRFYERLGFSFLEAIPNSTSSLYEWRRRD